MELGDLIMSITLTKSNNTLSPIIDHVSCIHIIIMINDGEGEEWGKGKTGNN